jgi:hypothetical protein
MMWLRSISTVSPRLTTPSNSSRVFRARSVALIVRVALASQGTHPSVVDIKIALLGQLILLILVTPSIRPSCGSHDGRAFWLGPRFELPQSPRFIARNRGRAGRWSQESQRSVRLARRCNNCIEPVWPQALIVLIVLLGSPFDQTIFTRRWHRNDRVPRST